jgi:hypothetical protein
LEADFALVPWGCAFRLEWLLHLVTIVGIGIAALGVLLSWRNWNQAGREPEDTADVLGRSRFMAGLGILLSTLFALILFGQEIANVVLRPCA